MIRTVKVEENDFFTMDEYDADLQLEESFDPTDPWWDEDNVKLDGMPDELWSDFPIDALPPDPPSWVDDLAGRAEVEHLKSMQVLIEELYEGDPVTAKLTTKHVHDWRLKPYGNGKKWLRRSRLVAPEFALKEMFGYLFSSNLFTCDECFTPGVRRKAGAVGNKQFRFNWGDSWHS